MWFACFYIALLVRGIWLGCRVWLLVGRFVYWEPWRLVGALFDSSDEWWLLLRELEGCSCGVRGTVAVYRVDTWLLCARLSCLKSLNDWEEYVGLWSWVFNEDNDACCLESNIVPGMTTIWPFRCDYIVLLQYGLCRGNLPLFFETLSFAALLDSGRVCVVWGPVVIIT